MIVTFTTKQMPINMAHICTRTRKIAFRFGAKASRKFKKTVESCKNHIESAFFTLIRPHSLSKPSIASDQSHASVYNANSAIRAFTAAFSYFILLFIRHLLLTT
ncbi:hypothetical protein SAMN04515617_103214 [Collimonas sp. OK242]|jgi:hypothetical protein|uniref:hypothetical protein n=1 Tax=Collimonas sp. OK242 TaxID=1798195 RepID=UPI0008952AFF|nr:hypothetical protein [Collimonas sp. OK242]SDX39720.1 hypothetical protein SAMN04515617_103214 [Collimonas sp. OK242]